MVPVAAPLGRSERRVAAASYVSGLLMPGQRKSIGPMAARLGLDPQRLQQFITDSPWDEEQLWQVIRQEVIRILNQSRHGFPMRPDGSNRASIRWESTISIATALASKPTAKSV